MGDHLSYRDGVRIVPANQIDGPTTLQLLPRLFLEYKIHA
jgi:hypothetical protein